MQYTGKSTRANLKHLVSNTKATYIQPRTYHEVYDGHDLISEVQWKVLSQTNSRFQFLCFSGHFRSSANACMHRGWYTITLFSKQCNYTGTHNRYSTRPSVLWNISTRTKPRGRVTCILQRFSCCYVFYITTTPYQIMLLIHACNLDNGKHRGCWCLGGGTKAIRHEATTSSKSVQKVGNDRLYGVPFVSKYWWQNTRFWLAKAYKGI